MKKIIFKLKDGIFLGIGFFIVFGIVHAWTGLQTTTGDTLTADKWNELVNKIDPITSLGGNVGIGTATPSSKLDVNGIVKLKGLDTTIYNLGGINSGSVTLSSSNSWADFPDLSKTFTMSDATTVGVNYQVTMYGSGSHLVTRLLVDGVEETRSISGDTTYWDNDDTWFGELLSGSHTIKVQYRSPFGGINYPAGNDWHNRQLQVLVFGS